MEERHFLLESANSLQCLKGRKCIRHQLSMSSAASRSSFTDWTARSSSGLKSCDIFVGQSFKKPCYERQV